ncbi:MAG: nitrous oxide reductase family maturation protein NosD, partial [Calditrichaeota bacterium]
MRYILALWIVLWGSLCARTWMVQAGGEHTSLPAAIHRAAPGDTLRVMGGIYPGPIHIDKPLILMGTNWPVIDGNYQGTVVEITAPGVVLEGFLIRNSGINLSNEDAGIKVDAPRAILRGNRLEDVLFGAYLRQADSSIIRNNVIRGRTDLDIPRRGDLIRVWYSNAVTVDNNTLESGRDMIIWFSRGSVVQGNRVSRARYGVHFMYSDDCRIEENVFTHNSVGVYLMYSRRLILRRNTIAYNRGASGFGVGVKDFDDGLIEENLIVDNRVGIFVDNSPRSMDSHMTYRGNVIAYNDVGISLLSFVKRSILNRNSFLENYEQVGVTGAGFLKGNEWVGNFWSDYAGYDAAGDGVGDIPYRSEKLFEELTDRKPELRLFSYSPAIQAVNFAARAFPLVRPRPRVT